MAVALLAALSLIVAPLPYVLAAAPEKLPLLARVGPWPVASRPILYRGRLWLANSVKGVDHNSSDIYSLGMSANDVRYERHLWSQDAGEPVVADGLLYWPAEDPRLFGDWGAFQVTNGEAWHTGLIPFGGIFHVHSIASAGDLLYAATSAWQATIHVSADRGRSWRRVYSHPKSSEGISRIVTLTVLRNDVIGLLRDPNGYRAVSISPDGARIVADWPASGRPTSLATLNGWTFGLVSHAARTELWRTDGSRAELVHRFADTVRPYALTAGNGALWALTQNGGEGAVLKSSNGREWAVRASIDGGEGHDLLIGEGTFIVTGAGTDGHGIVWGRFAGESAFDDQPVADLPEVATPGLPRQIDWTEAGSRLDSLLLDPQSYEKIGLAIRNRVYELLMSRPEPEFFAARLDSPRATGALNPFRDVVVPDKGSIGAFWLLWGMGLGKTGSVPARLIAAPWRVPENSAAKYFEAQLMAMWAASEIGQADRATIDALMSHITNTSDPLWLRMDAVGALTALTGSRYGADFAAWAKWYEELRP